MAEKTTPRLKTKYAEEVRPALLKEFQHGNVMEVGRVVKVVVNMGVGEAAHDSKMIEGAVRDLAACRDVAGVVEVVLLVAGLAIRIGVAGVGGLLTPAGQLLVPLARLAQGVLEQRERVGDALSDGFEWEGPDYRPMARTIRLEQLIDGVGQRYAGAPAPVKEDDQGNAYSRRSPP